MPPRGWLITALFPRVQSTASPSRVTHTELAPLVWPPSTGADDVDRIGLCCPETICARQYGQVGIQLNTCNVLETPSSEILVDSDVHHGSLSSTLSPLLCVLFPCGSEPCYNEGKHVRSKLSTLSNYRTSIRKSDDIINLDILAKIRLCSMFRVRLVPNLSHVCRGPGKTVMLIA
jgi:hypothetical protein